MGPVPTARKGEEPVGHTDRMVSSAGSALNFTVVEDVAPRGGYTTAVVGRGAFPDGTLFPFPCRLAHARRSTKAWVYADEEGTIAADSVALRPALQRELRSTAGASMVSIRLPRRTSLLVRTPPARDLPTSSSIHVSKAVYRLFRKGLRAPRVVMTSEQGICVPVTLRIRPLPVGHALVPMSLRTLAGIRTDSHVQLSNAPTTSLADRWERARRRIGVQRGRGWLVSTLATMLGLLLLGLRFLDYVLELVLRVLFGSRALSFRVIQAHPGDDDLADTVRLHPAAFAALDLTPGGHILLAWAGERVGLRALVDHDPFGPNKSNYVKGMVGVRYDDGPPDDFPPHLIVRIPAPVRRDLGIPPNTIVTVRRRVRPALVSQFNQLTLPIAGLALAAAAVPAVRGWPLVVGIVVAVTFGLAPLRTGRPPRGPWP